MRRTSRVRCGVALAACVAAMGSATFAMAPMAVAAPSSSGYGQTFLPHGPSLVAIACTSLTACVAVGEQGRIVTTEDGGQHWTNRASGTHVYLGNVSCPSRTVCHALGYHIAAAPPLQRQRAVFLTSIDGGKTWQSRTIHGPGFSLACPSVITCIAASYPTGPPTSPLRTTDGGKTWRTVQVPIPGGIGGITCATTTVCYGINSLNGALARSADAGRTWQPGTPVPHPSEEILEAIACPEATTCLVTSSYCCSEGQHGGIFLTRDGAKTWHRVDRLTAHATYGITCPRATTCYVSGHRFVLVTTDGGQTWAKRHVPDPVSDIGWSDTIACPRSLTCYAVAGFTVLKTVDGFVHVKETLPHGVIRRRLLRRAGLFHMVATHRPVPSERRGW